MLNAARAKGKRSPEPQATILALIELNAELLFSPKRTSAFVFGKLSRFAKTSRMNLGTAWYRLD